MNRLIRQIGQHPIEAVIAVLVVGSAVGIRGFFDAGNFQNILAQLAPVLLLACGQAVVMISGGLDLSQGSMVGVASVCFVVLSRHIGVVAAGAVTMGLAAAVGSINAVATRLLRNSFIATFSSMYVLMGAVIYATGGTPVSDMPAAARGALAGLGSGSFAGLPASFLFVLAPVGLLTWFLHRTRVGLEIYAWGSNATAARIHRIDEQSVLLASFALSAVFASLAGILLSARVLQGNPQMGEGLLFESIAACVVGGIALSGGHGGVWSAVRGCLLIAIIQNGLYLSDMNSHVRDIVVGVMIALSVLITRARISRPISNIL